MRTRRIQGFNDFSFPRARKRYRCAWCGECIEAGEKHGKFVGMFDGDFQSWRVHEECWRYLEKMQNYNADIFENGFQQGEYSRGLSQEAMTARRLMGIERYWMPDRDQKRYDSGQ